MCEQSDAHPDGPPWQRDFIGEAALSEALETPRVRLRDIRPDAEPATYLAFLGPEVARLPLWRPFAGGRICCYVGSTVDAADRMCRHRASLLGTELSSEDVWIALMPTDCHGWALLLESALCKQVRPVWCDSRLKGWGSRTRGKQREGGRSTAWDSLFPGRQWAQTPSAAERATAALDVIRHLGSGAMPGPQWPPLPTTAG